MKTYWEVEVWRHAFLTSALDGEWSVSSPGHFTTRERATGTHWTECQMGHRVGLDAVQRKKPPSLPLPGIEHQSSNQ